MDCWMCEIQALSVWTFGCEPFDWQSVNTYVFGNCKNAKLVVISQKVFIPSFAMIIVSIKLISVGSKTSFLKSRINWTRSSQAGSRRCWSLTPSTILEKFPGSVWTSWINQNRCQFDKILLNLSMGLSSTRCWINRFIPMDKSKKLERRLRSSSKQLLTTLSTSKCRLASAKRRWSFCQLKTSEKV